MGNDTVLADKKKALTDLIRDINVFDKLSERVDKPNIFSILRISRTEIRHSNMLAWLLDPNQNHNLGDAFLHRFIGQIDVDDSLLLKYLVSDLYSFQVYREDKFNQCPIDILLVSKQNKLVIAIENKVGAAEHTGGNSKESQLTVYKNGIKEKYKDGYEYIFIFLTPDGDFPTDDDWTVMTYEDILNALESTYSSKSSQLKEENRILINNYITIIKNEIIMDNELEAICQEIYKKHGAALDLIFEYRTDTTKLVSDKCKSVLEQLKHKVEGLDFDSSKKSQIPFWTKELKGAFGGDADDWNYKNNYRYLITIRPDKGTSIITLILQFEKEKNEQLDSPIKKKLIDFINDKTYIKKKDDIKEKINKDEWKYLTIWTSGAWNPYKGPEEDTDNIKKWIEKQCGKLSIIQDK